MKPNPCRIATRAFRIHLPSLALLLCLALVGALVGDSSAWAATLTVNDPADVLSASACTLRSAVQAVNTGTVAGTGCTNTGGAFGSGDFIQMAPSVTAISLADVADNDIVISVPTLTIAGPAGGRTTIAGPAPAGRTHYFRVFSHTGAGGTLTLQRLAIGGGAVNASSARSGGGGGIRSGGGVALQDVLIASNTTNCSGCGGGGVYALGDLQMSNTTFSTNETQGANSPGGAAIAFGNLAAISNASFVGNATRGDDSTGGALHLQTAASRIASSLFASNQTSGFGAFGGGFYATGPLELTNSYLYNNHAKGQGGGGMAASSTTISGSSFIGNVVSNAAPSSSAARGGALSLFSSPNTITNSTFNSNSASSSVANAGLGGAIWARMYLDIANSTLYGNSTTGLGGGVFFNDLGVTAVFNSTIVANSTSLSAASPNPDVDVHNNQSVITIAGSDNLIQRFANAVPSGTALLSDPLLETYRDNGCATQAGAPLTGASYLACPPTQLPRPGSPVINTGNNSKSLVADQRGAGYARAVGSGPDMGAVEATATPTAPGSVSAIPTLGTWALIALAGLFMLTPALQRARASW